MKGKRNKKIERSIMKKSLMLHKKVMAKKHTHKAKTLVKKAKTLLKSASKHVSAANRLNKNYKQGYKMVGKTTKSHDSTRRALPAGYRVSKSGRRYFENRANRSDASPRKPFL